MPLRGQLARVLKVKNKARTRAGRGLVVRRGAERACGPLAMAMEQARSPNPAGFATNWLPAGLAIS